MSDTAPPERRLLCYLLPLGEATARLWLPVPLTEEEAERVCHMLRTLAGQPPKTSTP